MAKADIQQVPDKTCGLALMTDLLTGPITMCFCNVTQVLPHVREGKLRALAATGLKRSAQAPDIPTMDETGFRGFDITSWFALMAPAGTPAAIVDKVYRETRQMLAEPDFRGKVRPHGHGSRRQTRPPSSPP